jgi:hypothetical protein
MPLPKTDLSRPAFVRMAAASAAALYQVAVIYDDVQQPRFAMHKEIL